VAAENDKLSEVSVKVPSDKQCEAEDAVTTQADEDISTGAPPSNEEALGPRQDIEVEPSQHAEEEPVASDGQAEPPKLTEEEQSAVDAQPEQQKQPVSEPGQPQDQPGAQELGTDGVQLEKAEAQVAPPQVQDEDNAKLDSKKDKPAKSRGWCLCGSKAGATVATDRKKQAVSQNSKDDVAVDETIKVEV
jgi:hypothetical protein